MKLRIGADRFTTNDNEVCEELNMKFQKVFTLEQGEVPDIREEIISQAPLEEFEIISGNVRKLLLEMNVTKAIGLEGITPWLLKEGAEALCLPLSMVYNKSQVTDSSPKCLTVPIYKKGDRQEALNYRPVSLTCIPYELMEKIVQKKLVDHLERRNFVTQHQNGFRDGMSCLTGLIEFYNQATGIRQERDGWADSIFLDYQKAFDTMPNQRLVRKQEMKAEVKGKMFYWIREYLMIKKIVRVLCCCFRGESERDQSSGSVSKDMDNDKDQVESSRPDTNIGSVNATMYGNTEINT
ncbi:uncharacterized protein [Procambarus clarkii]|uniref:uncharacterized protein n=1 Tax=Procambarus clarkii TaxID=6728 RepID=UPI003741EBC6